MKISFRQIIIDHFATLRTTRGSLLYSDILLFYVFPLVLAISAVSLNLFVTGDFSNLILTSFSIFAALLFNLLLLCFDIVQRPSVKESHDKVSYLKSFFANVSYCILVAIFVVLIVLIFHVSQAWIKNDWPVQLAVWTFRIYSVVVYFLAFNFALSLLMVLKRVHILLRNEFPSVNPKRRSPPPHETAFNDEPPVGG